MGFTKKNTWALLLIVSFSSTACTTNQPQMNESNSTQTTTNQKIEEEPSTALSIGVTALGYLLGAVLAAAVI